MKLREMGLANAFGVLGAVYYLVCFTVASVAPQVYKAVAASWMHMIDLSGVWKSAPSGFLLGIVSFTASAWISGWLLAKVYNSFAK